MDLSILVEQLSEDILTPNEVNLAKSEEEVYLYWMYEDGAFHAVSAASVRENFRTLAQGD